jgi:hypothetical protein
VAIVVDLQLTFVNLFALSIFDRVFDDSCEIFSTLMMII